MSSTRSATVLGLRRNVGVDAADVQRDSSIPVPTVRFSKASLAPQSIRSRTLDCQESVSARPAMGRLVDRPGAPDVSLEPKWCAVFSLNVGENLLVKMHLNLRFVEEAIKISAVVTEICNIKCS